MKSNIFIVSKTQQLLDFNLVPYDLWATKVHILMLNKQKLLKIGKVKKILKALMEIGQEYDRGKFSIDPDRGLHLTIEAKVIEKIGDDGYFMHTARSRNDQVMTCELLYLKEKALRAMSRLLDIQNSLMTLSKKHTATIMSGYTHMQPAKPTTFGQWSLSYLDMFEKCLDSFKYFYEKYDCCPAGAVESYGTSWDIDRSYSAGLLGFSSVWEIPQEAISSRGFTQLAYLGVLKDIAIIISKIAVDLLLFTTFEFGYVLLADTTAQQMGLVTGSSIMPQKKNPDVLELLRSIAPQIIGYETIVANLLSCLPVGYNRDTREIKEYITLGFSKVDDALDNLTKVLETIIVNKQKMQQSVLENYSLSADLADYLSQKKGLHYRKVYQLVGLLVKNMIVRKEKLNYLSAKELMETGKAIGLTFDIDDDELRFLIKPLEVVMKRIHIGGAGQKMMQKMIQDRKKLFQSSLDWIDKSWGKINSAKAKTAEIINNYII